MFTYQAKIPPGKNPEKQASWNVKKSCDFLKIFLVDHHQIFQNERFQC